MKKYLLVAVIIVAVIGVFVLGSTVGAGTVSWATQAVTDAKNKINGTANETTQDLTTDVNALIADKVKAELSGTVEHNQQFLENWAKNYFQGKIAGVTDSQDFKNIESQIAGFTDEALMKMKTQIDAAVAEALK